MDHIETMTNIYVFIFRLKPLDVEFMKQLHQKVNIVPVISRADAFTKKEVTEFKKRIRQEIQSHGIKVYTLPEVDEDEGNNKKT